MGRGLFITGMIRSGTTLAQTLLTNHPAAFVVYQPFHQLYIDAKRCYLEARGIDRLLPLGDGTDAIAGEEEDFCRWLVTHQFDDAEARSLARNAVNGKGGSVPNLADSLSASTGTFFEIRESLLDQVSAHYGASGLPVVGSKEVLCEEYVLPLADAGTQCVIVIRNPKAVVASASFGRYRAIVGDRYPLLMLIRLWRKSARHCIRLRERSDVHVVRYEDLATDSTSALRILTDALDIEPFPQSILEGPLVDHAGGPWHGNSSFGSKTGVDPASVDAWRAVVPAETAGMIQACTVDEMRELGYPTNMGTAERIERIARFDEDETNIRPAYRDAYHLDERTKGQELDRLTTGLVTP